jgi:hypothetical protein
MAFAIISGRNSCSRVFGGRGTRSVSQEEYSTSTLRYAKFSGVENLDGLYQVIAGFFNDPREAIEGLGRLS